MHSGNDRSWDWVCTRQTSLVLGVLLLLNLLSLLFNLLSYRRRLILVSGEQSPHPQLSDPTNRTIRNFQAYVIQHDLHSHSSVVPTSMVIESSVEGHSFEQPTVRHIPEQINCVEVTPLRKIFMGRIEWCGYDAFLKECINPIELQLHRRLSHDNIVQFYWSNMVDKPKIILSDGVECARHLPLSFYCMEYCRGGSLHNFLLEEGHAMCTVEMLGIISNVVSGLKYLHSQKISHRDIKCDNVMVQSTGAIVAKIADFDHAIDTKNTYELQMRERSRFGSPLYTAPEFLVGVVTSPGSAVASPGNAVASPGNAVASPGSADYLRHDIFSLGLLIWECLTWVKCRENVTNVCHSDLTTLLLPRQALSRDVTRESTHDIGQYRKLVTCSSTVHIALLQQLCSNLNLSYNKKHKAFRRNGVFVSRGDRLIDRTLMQELYIKDPNIRPVLFPDTRGSARELNELLEGCWKSNPSERLDVSAVHDMIVRIKHEVQNTSQPETV